MKRFALVMGALSIVVGLALPARADHAWEDYHWGRTSNPFTLTVVDSVTGVWDPLLQQVNADWSSSNVLDLRSEPGATDLVGRLLCLPLAGKIRACNANYGPNLWFGLATVWISGGHITQAVTQVNDFYFTGEFGNDVARRHVLCQEIGHDFGLDHHEQVSCMDDTNSTLNLASHQSPNNHDFQQLSAIYSHTDPSNTYSSQTAAGRSSSLVRHEDGQTVITSIFWV